MACLTTPSYASLKVTTSSVTTQLGGPAEPIFDSDHASIVIASDTSYDIAYAPTAGTLTFGRTGIYHIVLSLVTIAHGGDDALTTVSFLQNSTVMYQGLSFGDNEYGSDSGIESTHQRILSITAGDVLTVKASVYDGATARTVGVGLGTSLTATEITTGVYASSTVTASGSVNQGNTQYNAYRASAGVTDLAFTGSNAKIASGITWDDDKGIMSVPSDGDGTYYVMVNNIHVGPTDISMNNNCHIRLYNGEFGEGSPTEIWKGTHRGAKADDPTESTISVIETLAGGDKLSVTFQGASAGKGVVATSGSTFTAYKLDDAVTSNQVHACVYNKAISSWTDTTNISAFKNSNYSSPDLTERAVSGIGSLIYSAGTGRFTVSKDGRYFCCFKGLCMAQSADVDKLTSTITVNGDEAFVAESKVDSFPDPLCRSYTTILNLSKDDYVEAWIKASTDAVAVNQGTTLSLFRLPNQSLVEDAPVGLISDDNTINTFSVDNLTVQYGERGVDRNNGAQVPDQGATDQVPFKFGIRGPGSLRGDPCSGRTTVDTIVTGDKKN